MQPLLIIATLLPFCRAQNTTFDPNSVDQTTRNQWCQSEINACIPLCGGNDDDSISENGCDSATLDYTCVCSNQTSPPNIAQYQGTIPNFICQREYSQCTTHFIGRSDEENCTTCGTLQPTDATKSITATPTSMKATAKISANAATTRAQSSATVSTAAAATSSPAKSGLSTSGKIGIGIGVPLGVFAIAALVASLLIWRRRRSRFENADDINDAEKPAGSHGHGPQELDGDGNPVLGELETGDPPPYARELVGSPGRQGELQGTPGQQRYELE